MAFKHTHTGSHVVKLWQPKHISRSERGLNEMDICLTVYDRIIREKLYVYNVHVHANRLHVCVYVCVSHANVCVCVCVCFQCACICSQHSVFTYT